MTVRYRRWVGLMVLATGMAHAEPPPDPSSIWTLQVENDALNGTDRYYTSGVRVGWTSPTEQVPDLLARLGRAAWGDGRQRISVDVAQSIFTPYNTQLDPPDPRDRPYAGLLLADVSLVQDTDRSRSILGASLGVVGPAAGGEAIQNGWHSLIGNQTAKGWGYQIHDEPVVQFLAERIWRLPLGTLPVGSRGVEVDALPSLTGAVGTWRVYGLAGAQIRFGQGLDLDFGAPRIRPALTGEDAYVASAPFVWYVFGGIDGQVVGYDVTLNGNLFSSSRHVTPNTFVGEIQGGIAMLFHGIRISFTHVLQTQTFEHQRGGLFNFDSVSVSAKF